MTKDEFITERTRIISEMLDNPNELEIYPTTKCFEQLDELFDKIVADEVNRQAMIHYIDKFTEQKEINKKLGEVNDKLKERDNWLKCLEAAGVDNWEGYDIAQDMRDEA